MISIIEAKTIIENSKKDYVSEYCIDLENEFVFSLKKPSDKNKVYLEPILYSIDKRTKRIKKVLLIEQKDKLLSVKESNIHKF